VPCGSSAFITVVAKNVLFDQDPGKVGFPKFRGPRAADLKLHEKLNGGLFAFTADADRDAAHKNAKEWFDKQQKADPKVTVRRRIPR
jgi:hypothetical protein